MSCPTAERARLHALASDFVALLDDGTHHEAGTLDNGEARMLEELVEHLAPIRHHVEQRVELVARRRLRVRRAQSERKEVEQRADH